MGERKTTKQVKGDNKIVDENRGHEALLGVSTEIECVSQSRERYLMATGWRLVVISGMLVVIALAALYQFDLTRETRKGTEDRIAERAQAIRHRSAAKKQITWDLIEGRLTLFEAAAAFRRWNEAYPQLPDPSLPGDSVEERLCRQVIEWVSLAVVERGSSFVEHLCEKLDEELRQHKERNGKVILPAQ
jgi:hypothetical protein